MFNTHSVTPTIFTFWMPPTADRERERESGTFFIKRLYTTLFPLFNKEEEKGERKLYLPPQF